MDSLAEFIAVKKEEVPQRNEALRPNISGKGSFKLNSQQKHISLSPVRGNGQVISRRDPPVAIHVPVPKGINGAVSYRQHM